MRTVLFLGVTSLAVATSGCIVESSNHDHDGGSGSQGSLYLTWQIQVAGASATCADVGATKVQMDVYYESSTNPTATYEFPCADGTLGGETTGLADGGYWATIRLMNASNTVLSETTATGPYFVEYGYATDMGDTIFQVAPTDQFFYVNWVIHKCADANCTYDQPGEVACPTGSTVVLTVDGVAYEAVDCNARSVQTTTLTPGQHNIGIQLLGCSANAGGVCSQFPGSGAYPITIQQGVPYGAQLIFAIY